MDYTANPNAGLSEEKQALFGKFRQELIISGYSARTMKMYLCYAREFLGFLTTPVSDACRDDVVAFIANKKEVGNASNATLALVHAALKFLDNRVLKKKILDDIKIPKKAKKPLRMN